MARTITLRPSDSAYEAVKRYAEADLQSMNAWIEGVLDVEDMRRRCAAHDQWLTDHPQAVSFAEPWPPTARPAATDPSHASSSPGRSDADHGCLWESIGKCINPS